VLAILGEPTQRPQLLFPEEGLYDKKLVWPDAVAYFIDDRLAFLESNRRGVCTGRRVCLGDSAGAVRRRIGCESEFDASTKSFSCFDTQSACSIVATVLDGAASGFRLQCLP